MAGDDFDTKECKKKNSKVKTKAGGIQVIPGGWSLYDKQGSFVALDSTQSGRKEINGKDLSPHWLCD